MKCPICKGKGKLEEPVTSEWRRVITKKIMCRLLRKEGYSYRQIMRFLDLKSPRSIQQYLK